MTTLEQPTPPMRYRRLRISWSVGWIVASLLVIALWMRSYRAFDYVSGMATASRQVEVFAVQGRVVIGTWGGETTFTRWYHRSNAVADSQGTVNMLKNQENAMGFAIIKPSVVIPYYFFAAVTGALAVAPWIRWSKRFTIRTLLIATTLVAAILGLATWAVSR